MTNWIEHQLAMSDDFFRASELLCQTGLKLSLPSPLDRPCDSVGLKEGCRYKECGTP